MNKAVRSFPAGVGRAARGALAGVTCLIMKMVSDRGEVDGCFVTGGLTVW